MLKSMERNHRNEINKIKEAWEEGLPEEGVEGVRKRESRPKWLEVAVKEISEKTNSKKKKKMKLLLQTNYYILKKES